MPRDSLTDSSRTMINQGGVMSLAALKQKQKHIGPIDPHALKIPARRAESLFGEIHPHLCAEPKQHSGDGRSGARTRPKIMVHSSRFRLALLLYPNRTSNEREMRTKGLLSLPTTGDLMHTFAANK